MAAKRVLIMGAAGRDFHNFNVCFRNNPAYKVVAFTASQIPGIAGRTYPKELAGDGYPKGIPIHEESALSQIIKRYAIQEVVFAYSDIAHVDVMHKASLVNAAGADFRLMGTSATMLKSSKPVVAVCSIRTGAGKSPTSLRLAELLRKNRKSVAVVRHPMPYGDLNAQRCQRFETIEDFKRNHCTIEEMEEYECHLGLGHIVYAGVDYLDILRRAESEADIVLWDGGNNDTPFYKPDLHMVLVDPHRPGHETLYYPGETNLRMADIILVSKCGTARHTCIDQVTESARKINPRAKLIGADTVVRVQDELAIRGKRVLAVEDGPTVTHGEMANGVAHLAARRFGAAEIVDPRPYAVGSIRSTFANYTHLKDVLPAMGYGEEQVADLQATIEAVPCDLVLIGTPFDLARIVHSSKPMTRVTYALDENTSRELESVLEDFLAQKQS
jgi:predicted GTPase